jgi:hypothetical protein
MINETPKQCKSKACYNPVLDGKYCEQCKQKRKEKGVKILTGAGGTAILVVGAAIKKGIIKQGPKIARAAIKVVLKV